MNSLPAGSDVVLERIREEHRALAKVIEALEAVTATTVDTQAAPDFALLATMLYYVDAVPEKFHHPKEDRFLFAALRRRDPESHPLLDRLEREHRRSPQLVGELERALVHWQGGAPDGLDRFVLALTVFCEFHWSHMRAEESEVLPRAEHHLVGEDWSALAAAFDANQDPLFGADRKREFDRLYQRIANLAPRKLRVSLLKRQP